MSVSLGTASGSIGKQVLRCVANGYSVNIARIRAASPRSHRRISRVTRRHSTADHVDETNVETFKPLARRANARVRLRLGRALVSSRPWQGQDIGLSLDEVKCRCRFRAPDLTLLARSRSTA